MACFLGAGLSSACSDDEGKRASRLDASTSGAADAAAADASPRDTAGGDGPSTGSPNDGGGDAALLASEVIGYYSGDWGNMVLKDVNGEIWASYTHDTGTIIGTFSEGVLVGWWSEVPSRLPTADAGEVEFRFERRNGEVFINGRWRYGTEGAWREDWDIGLVKMAPPPALVARFDDPTAFKRHP